MEDFRQSLLVTRQFYRGLSTRSNKTVAVGLVQDFLNESKASLRDEVAEDALKTVAAMAEAEIQGSSWLTLSSGEDSLDMGDVITNVLYDALTAETARAEEDEKEAEAEEDETCVSDGPKEVVLGSTSFSDGLRTIRSSSPDSPITSSQSSILHSNESAAATTIIPPIVVSSEFETSTQPAAPCLDHLTSTIIIEENSQTSISAESSSKTNKANSDQKDQFGDNTNQTASIFRKIGSASTSSGISLSNPEGEISDCRQSAAPCCSVSTVEFLPVEMGNENPNRNTAIEVPSDSNEFSATVQQTYHVSNNDSSGNLIIELESAASSDAAAELSDPSQAASAINKRSNEPLPPVPAATQQHGEVRPKPMVTTGMLLKADSFSSCPTAGDCSCCGYTTMEDNSNLMRLAEAVELVQEEEGQSIIFSGGQSHLILLNNESESHIAMESEKSMDGFIDAAPLTSPIKPHCLKPLILTTSKKSSIFPFPPTTSPATSSFSPTNNGPMVKNKIIRISAGEKSAFVEPKSTKRCEPKEAKEREEEKEDQTQSNRRSHRRRRLHRRLNQISIPTIPNLARTSANTNNNNNNHCIKASSSSSTIPPCRRTKMRRTKNEAATPQRKKMNENVHHYYDCEYCPNRYRSERRRNCHMKCHTTRRFRECCVYCGRLLNTVADYRDHLSRVHSRGETVIQGKIHQKLTDKRTTTATRNTHHVLLHCSKCSFSTKFSQNLSRHIRKIHRTNQAAGAQRTDKESLTDAGVPCPDCGKTLGTKSALREHAAYTHPTAVGGDGRGPDGGRQYECPVAGCSKRFTLRKDLNKHSRFVHSDQRGFPCDLCPKSFKTSQHLKRHRRDVHHQLKKEKS